jgi:hypothetical protein
MRHRPSDTGDMTQATQTARSAPQPRRRRCRFGLRTLLGLVTVLCVVLGLWVQRAERQRRAVAAIVEAGGSVAYDGQLFGIWFNDDLPGPDWLCRLTAVDYFAAVSEILCVGDTADQQCAHVARLPRNPTSLFLQSSHVTDAGLANLSKLTELQVLNLDSTGITDAGVEHLKGLTGLQALCLDNTRIGDEGLEHLKGLTRLRHLSLNNTQVSDAGVKRLRELTGLQMLGLDGTQVSDAGVAELETAMPRCWIFYQGQWHGPNPSAD